MLLATKLHPPVRRGLVTRPRLVDRLRPTERRITVLEAPAGWGKTSLLTDWAASAAGGLRVAWVALDGGDNDPVLFWSYVLAALRTCTPAVSDRPLAALRAGARALREAALPLLVNDLVAAPDPLVLVLDDYHVIAEPDVHETLALLLDRLPPPLHVVVAGRADPPLPLGRLRAAGELTRLRTDDLAFTVGEVGRFLNDVHGLGLAAADVARLARRTEGWPAGLALAAASLAERARGGDLAAFLDDFTGTDRYVLDYLCTEVLAGLPEKLRGFLLRTSILRRLSAPLCEAVTGRTDAADILDRLERAGVFLVPLDGERRWYRHHRLFGELLRHELARAEPAFVPELHRRAAGALVAVGAVGDAIEHLVAAGDALEAAELVAGHWNDWFNSARLATVTAWLDALPPAVVRADPRLCTARAWLALDLARLDDVDAWISTGDAAAEPDDTSALRDLAVVRTVHRFKIGDVGAAQAAARRVLELSGAGPSFAVTVAHLLLGLTAYWRGDATTARRALGEAVRLARRTGNALAETYGLGYLGLVAVDDGALDDARRMVPVGLERLTEPAVAEHFVAALPQMARSALLAATGRTGAATEAAVRAVDLARRGAGRLELALALALRAQTAVMGGRDAAPMLDEARALVRRCPDPGWLPARLAKVQRAQPVRAPGPAPRSDGTVALSERERELLPLLAGTLSQREIGAVLHVSLNTVKTHSRMLFRKLGVSSRAEAVSRARELGIF